MKNTFIHRGWKKQIWVIADRNACTVYTTIKTGSDSADYYLSIIEIPIGN